MPNPTTATQVRNTRMNTSGRSMRDRWISGGSPSSVRNRSWEYRVPIPRAVRPSPITAPAVMIAPHSARIPDPPGSASEAEHPHAAGQNQQYPGGDHDAAAAPASGPGAVLPARTQAAEPTEESAAPGSAHDRFPCRGPRIVREVDVEARGCRPDLAGLPRTVVSGCKFCAEMP